MWTIKDIISPAVYQVDDLFDVADKLNDMFDRDAHAYQDVETGTDHTIGEVIDDLMMKLRCGEYAGNEEACLGVEIY